MLYHVFSEMALVKNVISYINITYEPSCLQFYTLLYGSIIYSCISILLVFVNITPCIYIFKQHAKCLLHVSAFRQ